MANKKKKNPRIAFIIFRVTNKEKQFLEEEAMRLNRDFSDHLRRKLGLNATTD